MIMALELLRGTYYQMTNKKPEKKKDEDLTDDDIDRAATERIGGDGEGLILEDE